MENNGRAPKMGSLEYKIVLAVAKIGLIEGSLLKKIIVIRSIDNI